MLSDNLFSVSEKVCIVTGGMGQLGKQFSRALLERGAKVSIWGRHVPDDLNFESIAKNANAENLMFCKVDITNKESIEAALDKVSLYFGVPDVIVNNAGIDTQPSAPPEVSGPFENFPEDVFRQVVDTNLVGTFLVSQACGKRMVEAGKSGSIINIGSIYGVVSPVQDIYAYKEELTGIPFVKPVAYCAAKSGVYNLTRYMATYWGKKGIRVNTLTPSGVRRDDQDKQFQTNYCNRIPIGRMAEADEYNGAIIFLASDASSYMTGSNLTIDGGWTAW
ncbi:MAG: SDR family oxidoreductase [Angelakisella sp.]|nr:SDR family oxidoreductase [Angelakisella sp.]